MTLTLNRPEAFLRLPDGVLFDTDNTLYPYEPAHTAAILAAKEKAVQLFGIDCGDFDEAYNASRQAVKKRLGDTASSHSRLLYFQGMLERIGLGSQILRTLELEQTYWRTFLANAKLFDGLREFLDDLRIAGIPTAIVTDLTAQIQFRKVVYLGLDRYFDHIVTSEEAGFDKPHRAPFELAVSKLKPSGACVWMIGDNSRADIEGAKTAISAVTLQKVHAGVAVGEGTTLPDALVPDFDSLRRLLREIQDRVP